MGVKVSTAVITGWVLPVCVVFLAAADARAAPRRVVIVNCAAGPAGASAAADLRRELLTAAELAPMPGGNFSRAFEQVLPDKTRTDVRLREAQVAVSRAREALARFAYDDAIAELGRAESLVLELPPSRRVQLVLAQINFIAGRTYIDRGNREHAVIAFRAVRTLDPDQKELDPAVYVNEIVRAFAEAGRPVAGTAEVELTTTYDGAAVYVDGMGVDVSGGSLAVAPGIHYFTAIFPEHRPIGQRAMLTAGSRVSVKLRVVPEDLDERARAMRRKLLTGVRGFADSARTAVSLAGVDAAIMLRSSEGRILAAVFDARRDALGEWLPLGADAAGNAELLAALLPRVAPVRPPIEIPPPPPPQPRWYEKSWGKVAIIGGGGLAVTAIGLIARSLSSSEEDKFTPVLCFGFEPCQ